MHLYLTAMEEGEITAPPGSKGSVDRTGQFVGGHYDKILQFQSLKGGNLRTERYSNVILSAV